MSSQSLVIRSQYWLHEVIVIDNGKVNVGKGACSMNSGCTSADLRLKLETILNMFRIDFVICQDVQAHSFGHLDDSLVEKATPTSGILFRVVSYPFRDGSIEVFALCTIPILRRLHPPIHEEQALLSILNKPASCLVCKASTV